VNGPSLALPVKLVILKFEIVLKKVEFEEIPSKTTKKK